MTRVSRKLARASRTPKVVACPCGTAVACPCIMAVVVSAVSVCFVLSAGRKMSDWNESAWMLGAAGHNPRGKGDDEECCQGSCPSSSGCPHLHPTGPPTSSGPSGRTHQTLPASVSFSLTDSRMLLLSFFTWYSQFSLITLRTPTSVPDFGLAYPTFEPCL